MLVMQPFTTSRIVSINVRAGDHVVKGQVLVRFDPVFAQADVASLGQKVAMLTAETERLDAELRGAAYTAEPGDGPERVTQAQIYDQEMSNYQAETGQRDSQLGQTEAQIAPMDNTLPGLRAQLGIATR